MHFCCRTGITRKRNRSVRGTIAGCRSTTIINPILVRNKNQVNIITRIVSNTLIKINRFNKDLSSIRIRRTIKTTGHCTINTITTITMVLFRHITGNTGIGNRTCLSISGSTRNFNTPNFQSIRITKGC